DAVKRQWHRDRSEDRILPRLEGGCQERSLRQNDASGRRQGLRKRSVTPCLDCAACAGWCNADPPSLRQTHAGSEIIFRRWARNSGRGAGAPKGSLSGLSTLLKTTKALLRGHGVMFEFEPCMRLQSKNVTLPVGPVADTSPPSAIIS